MQIRVGIPKSAGWIAASNIQTYLSYVYQGAKINVQRVDDEGAWVKFTGQGEPPAGCRTFREYLDELEADAMQRITAETARCNS